MFGTQEYVCIFPNLTSWKQGFELFWAMDLLYLCIYAWMGIKHDSMVKKESTYRALFIHVLLIDFFLQILSNMNNPRPCHAS